MSPRRLLLMVATRKGAWLYHGDGPAKLGGATGRIFSAISSIIWCSIRDGRTMFAAAKTGHLGPTVFRSTDFGLAWQEAKRPLAFATASDSTGRAVDHTFWLMPGYADETDVRYAGTSPNGCSGRRAVSLSQRFHSTLPIYEADLVAQQLRH